MVFGLTRPGIESESTVLAADALSTRAVLVIESNFFVVVRLEFLKKAARLKADNLQKIVMKFQVQSLTDKALLSPHQVTYNLYDANSKLIFKFM